MAFTLGLDLSTQSCSGVVIDTDSGRLIAEVSINFGECLPQYKAPNGFIPDLPKQQVHSDPCMWLDALELLLDELKGRCDFSKIVGISGAGQQHGSVYLNESWFEAIQALNPENSLSAQLTPCLSRKTSPIWMDGSTFEECREIAEAVGGDSVVCDKSGSVAIERFTGPQIRRFYKKHPDRYEQTRRIHLVSSFFCSVLSGQDAPIDTGDGAGMNLLNIHDWAWDESLMEATAPSLAERLPRVVQGATQVGDVSTYFVEKYGFAEGTPIVVFTGDNPSSLVGMGASKPGKVVISLGTSDTLFAAMPEIVSDPDGCGHVFGNPGGGSMSLQCFINGSLAREAVRDRFQLDWDAFTRALESIPAGNHGNQMLPFFRPEISPRMELEEPLLRGSPAFENWQDGPAAVRGCVEGQFLNMKAQSEWMQLTPETLYLTGGASQNDAIAQILADVFQTRVERLAITGSVGLGAALRAASQVLEMDLNELESQFCKTIGGRSLEPNLKQKAAYESALSDFRKLLNQAG